MNSWIIENLGWTLLQSLWQIGFIAAVLFCLLRIFRDFSANLRYFISVSALVLSFILPIITFVYFSSETNQVQPTTQNTLTVSKQVPIQETKKQIISENINVPQIISADNSVSSPLRNISLMPILVGFWLIGIMFFSIRLLGGIWAIHLYKTKEVSKVEAHWQTKFDELCERLKIKQKIKFLKSKKVEMPMVIGWLKPVVLVPASAFLQISPQELETILIHELIHIKRRDYLVNFLQTLVEILFFYHPCVWWISAKIRAEREFAVDEFISQTFEKERFVYARALATLEEIRTSPTTNLAMAANGGNLMKRIENILNGGRKINSKNLSIWSAVFVVTLISGIAVGVYWLKSDNKMSVRKIAIVYGGSPSRNENQLNQEFFSILEKHEIPAVWIPGQSAINQMINDESAKSIVRNRFNQNIKFAVNVSESSSGYVVSEANIEEFANKKLNILNETLAEAGGKTDYFFFLDGPNLYRSKEGQSVEKSLFEKGLKAIPSSAPFYDSLFMMLYETNCSIEPQPINCQGDIESKQTIREKYLQFMTDQIESMEYKSKEILGREIPQVLYFSPSKLNDDAGDQIFQMLKDKGYEFVPLDEVTSDEAYAWQEKVRKVMRFDRNRWDATSEYLKEELKIFQNRLEVSKPIEGKVENGKVTIKTK